MWLSHHSPEQLDRCVRVGHRHVCRRCLVLYPLAFASLAAAVAAPSSVAASRWWVVAWWALPAPAILDWAAESAQRARYSPRRQVAATVLVAPALGSALAVWVRDPGALRVAAPFGTWALVCLAIWVWAQARSMVGIDTGWEERFERAEAERRARLAEMVGVAPDQPELSVTKSSSSSTAPTNDGSRSR